MIVVGKEGMIQMSDVFKEQMVAVKKTSSDGIKKTGIVIAAIIIGFLGIMFGGTFIGPMVVVGLVVGVVYLVKSMNLEYEYALTNDELDVDKIINKERRKRVLIINIKEMQMMAHINDGMRKAEIDQAQKTIDVSSGEVGADTYAILFMHENTLTKLVFEPNDGIQKGIYRQAPSKVFLQR